jgi:2-polyprenyl-3-methyl-5-hydroxy-6-metoxy-1,4-benzoquinol methylase
VDFDCPDQYFDCIICADVLEHTRDPWIVLKRLMRILQDEGVIIVSLPNLRHLSCILKIITDRFEYEREGILDKTHLRFFTLHTMRKLFDETGYEIRQIAENRSRRWQFRLLDALSLGLMRPFSVYQYLFVLKKHSA